MNRQPTRTDLVEAHQAELAAMAICGVDARTKARAFSDLADTLTELPTKGELWDVARAELVDEARSLSNIQVQYAIGYAEHIEELKERGIPL